MTKESSGLGRRLREGAEQAVKATVEVVNSTIGSAAKRAGPCWRAWLTPCAAAVCC